MIFLLKEFFYLKKNTNFVEKCPKLDNFQDVEKIQSKSWLVEKLNITAFLKKPKKMNLQKNLLCMVDYFMQMQISKILQIVFKKTPSRILRNLKF